MEFTGAPWIVVAPIVLPLAAATLTFLLRVRTVLVVSLLTSLGVVAAVVGLSIQVLEEGAKRYPLGGWNAPLGIELYVDGLSTFMLLMTAVVGVAVSVYTIWYFPAPGEARERRPGDSGDKAGSFWVLWMFLWTSLNGLFLSADIFNLYVTLELLGLSSAALITLERERTAITAGTRYLLLSLLGSLAYLIGVALLYGAFGSLNLEILRGLMIPSPPAYAALALMTVGMALKTALFPLHFWLPPAHANAPTPVSALLSALVVKASFYLILRLWFDVFPRETTIVAAQLLGMLGAAAIVWGSVLALRQKRLKLLIAYSTVAQVGYLFLLFPLVLEAGPSLAAWSGGIYHAFSHACAKAAMFMAAGTAMTVLGHDYISRMGGLFRHMPLGVASFAIAGITLMGLPPSGGFTAKWLLLVAALESGRWDLVAIISLGGLLAAFYLLLFLNRAVIHIPAENISHSAPRGMEYTAFALAMVSLLLGLISAPLLDLLWVGAPFSQIPTVEYP